MSSLQLNISNRYKSLGRKELVLDDDDHAAGFTGILGALVATTLNML